MTACAELGRTALHCLQGQLWTPNVSCHQATCSIEQGSAACNARQGALLCEIAACAELGRTACRASCGHLMCPV